MCVISLLLSDNGINLFVHIVSMVLITAEVFCATSQNLSISVSTWILLVICNRYKRNALSCKSIGSMLAPK